MVRSTTAGSETRRAGATPALAPVDKPLKRPSQARAQFTVQAIYDAFVRIWKRDGWDKLTTRAVALETGVSVGTLYEYFPNKQAMLSGYVRHGMDMLLAQLRQDTASLTWQQRVARLVRLNCGVGEGLPYFDRDMLLLESQIAEPKHHRRVYEEVVAAWRDVLAACEDLPAQPSDDLLRALVVSTFGGRRYMLLVHPRDYSNTRFADAMAQACVTVLAASAAA